MSHLARTESVLQILTSKCYPVLPYELEACVLNIEEYRSIDFTTTRFFMKVFRIVNSEIITYCQTFVGIDYPSFVKLTISPRFVARYNNRDY